MEFRLRPLGFMEFFAKQLSGSLQNEMNRKNRVKKPLGFCKNLYV